MCAAAITCRQQVQQAPVQQPERLAQQVRQHQQLVLPERQALQQPEPEQVQREPEQRQAAEREEEVFPLFCHKQTKIQPTKRRAEANFSS